MPISKNTLDFLSENRIMDNKAWFEQRRNLYNEYVLAPIAEIVEKLAPKLNKIDSRLVVEPKIGKVISRIYRDTRFSKDKSLFRDCMWCIFTHPRKDGYWPPGFYFEFSPDGFSYGAGDYQMPAAVMSVVREWVLKNDRRYIRAQEESEKCGFDMCGDFYKRPRYRGESEKKRQWLERRTVYFKRESKDFNLLFSESLHEVLAEGFASMAEIHRFLNEAAAYAGMD